MMRSLFSGVSGLKTHQTKMDVIGNNIANVNTVSYKASSIVFSELMSQTTQRASGPNAETGVGGTNAKQIGLGVRAGAINTAISTQGAAQSTGNPFDIMVNGSAFFVVSNGSENFFTRDGSFYVDAVGNLAMTSTGYNVMGWQVDETTGQIKQDTVSALRIMSAANMTYPPEATTKAYVSGILDKNDTDVTSTGGKIMNLNFYDALGYSYTAKIAMKQSDNKNEYSLELDSLLDSKGNEIDISKVTLGNTTTQKISSSIKFNSEAYDWNGLQMMNQKGEVMADLSEIFSGADGEIDYEAAVATDNPEVSKQLDNLAAAYGYEGAVDDFLNLLVPITTNDGGTADDVTDDTIENFSVKELLSNRGNAAGDPMFDLDATTINSAGRYFEGALVTFNPDTGMFNGINADPAVTNITMGLSGLGGNFQDIELDFSTLSSVNNKGTSTANATSGDVNGLGTGRRLGEMSGVTIQKDGMIYATYDNGMTRLLGQIAVAEFANASGLEKQGNNLYSATLNSGEFDGIGIDITASGGSMSTGQLEMSNVDLSAEFTEMITTQRGFQANSRIITVSDTLLEELTNLKR